jgi:MFS family permease
MIHRRVFLPLYLPALLLGIPAQAAFVLLPLYVLDQGGSPAAAAAVVGMRGVGMMVMDVPAGMLAARHGERFVMLLATFFIASAFIGYGLAADVRWLYLIAFLHGCGSSTFLLGRMAYVSAYCTAAERGRVIAMVAGSIRAAALIGPAVGGIAAHYLGYPLTFLCAAVSVLMALACVFAFAQAERPAARELDWRSAPRLAFEYRRVFATAGVAAVSFMLLRESRTVLLPLIGASLGLDPRHVGWVVSLAAAVDVALFYPAGVIMDRHGRRATAVPSSILFVVTLAALVLAQDFYSLAVVAALVGIANGLSTGIVMTLGTDLAPPARRGEFLGVWRLLTDFGTASGPLVISALVAVAPLSVAALGVAAIGAVGSFVVWRFVEETLPAA